MGKALNTNDSIENRIQWLYDYVNNEVEESHRQLLDELKLTKDELVICMNYLNIQIKQGKSLGDSQREELLGKLKNLR